MAEIKWLPGARDDLQRLHTFIAGHNSKAAHQAIIAILEAVSQLGQFPELGRPWEADPGFREYPVSFGARGYVVRYRLFKNQVIIVRVWHALEAR